MLIFFVSLSIALNFSGNFLSLGSFSLSIACQMLVPLIALCYFPWFTKHGIALGLVVGIIVVFLTDEIGQIILGNALVWNKWPFTVHSSAWGVFFNLLAALTISFITQDTKENNHKHKFHEQIIHEQTLS